MILKPIVNYTVTTDVLKHSLVKAQLQIVTKLLHVIRVETFQHLNDFMFDCLFHMRAQIPNVNSVSMRDVRSHEKIRPPKKKTKISNVSTAAHLLTDSTLIHVHNMPTTPPPIECEVRLATSLVLEC